ncbi:MAG: hypothetical protein M3P11_05065 [Actinomycetota bacterium]|nr:hypothetical protein [Actinomycetota bacterium]
MGQTQAAPLFTDGFESGDLSAWSASSGFTVQRQVVFDGSWAGRATTTGPPAYVSKTLAPTRANVYADVHVDLLGASGTVQLLRLCKPKGGQIVGVWASKNGTLVLRDYVTGVSYTSTSSIARGTWHELQLHAGINGTSSQVDVWLDDVKLGISGTYSLGMTKIGQVALGTTATTGRSSDVAFDDVVTETAFIDTVAPSVPTGLSAAAVTANEVALTWNDSTDNVGVAGYTIYRDGTAVGTSTTASFADKTFAPATPYSFTVDAVDAGGNHSAQSAPLDVTTQTSVTPIQHVVVIDQENHSFDDTLGKLCAEITNGTITGHDQCDGATEGTISSGRVIPLAQEPDIVPGLGHGIAFQRNAIDGGKMDRFDRISGCSSSGGFACYAQFDPEQIPNLAALATTYVISDRTFEFATSPSWAGHMVLASATQDGFDGDNPQQSTFTSTIGPGWGCDSYKDANWWNGSQYVLVPSCVPDQSGMGPYRESPVPYVPTIFDRLDAAGLTWKIYGGAKGPDTSITPYGWTICPTFYECLASSQSSNMVNVSTVTTDAQAGDLPSLSLVMPIGSNSQHNHTSMAVGDNWLGQVVSAIEGGSDWSSTAIFITYDDCGCFYDHVPPPSPDIGIRVPMVIISPYAKPGFTDSNTATYMSMLAFTEHTFGLPPLTSADGTAYGYSDAFDYSQTLRPGPKMLTTHVSKRELAYIAAHPPDEDDPT